MLNNHSYHSYGDLSRDGLTCGGRFTGPVFLPVRGRVTRPATPLCRGRPLILAPEGCSWAQPFPQRLLSHPKGTAGTFRALPSMVLPGWVRCTGFPPRAVLVDTSGPDAPASLQQQRFLLSAAPGQVRRALRPQSGPRYCQSRDSGSRLRAFCTQERQGTQQLGGRQEQTREQRSVLTGSDLRPGSGGLAAAVRLLRTPQAAPVLPAPLRVVLGSPSWAHLPVVRSLGILRACEWKERSTQWPQVWDSREPRGLRPEQVRESQPSLRGSSRLQRLVMCLLALTCIPWPALLCPVGSTFPTPPPPSGFPAGGRRGEPKVFQAASLLVAGLCGSSPTGQPLPCGPQSPWTGLAVLPVPVG